ncbi:MAG TPA: UDP-4-amino-4,6-dideoxy-N-acetyl-beta-L-altrosamine transaminase [Polyangia bacterium]|nr:UDP-4-amino-4,6-dideoxy-N-acetyl-beta-L-altrosamine transaminase [Polyangia bacterium]
MIPYGRQSISEDDVEAVAATLRSDWLTQGPAIDRFEKKVAEYCGARFGVAVSNGTAALHVACRAAGLGPGDLCWTTPNSFVASANAALYCGAAVDFVDIDPHTYNIDPVSLEAKLLSAHKLGRLPKVVIPVHFSGQSCRMDAIATLAIRFGFTIIEDACHAIGGSFQGARIGSGVTAAMTVFSFHPVKIVTTGEGGMVMTNDPALRRRLLRLRSHGITREPDELEHNGDEPWYYEQQELGWNYRITDLQAALGISQMSRIDAFVARRAELAGLYDNLLKAVPVTLPHRDRDLASAHHLYVIQLDPQRGAVRSRREVFKGMRARGIGVNVHYIPIPAQPYYRRLGFHPEAYPKASAYYRNAITLPLYPDMTSSDVQRVVDALTAELAG